MENTYPGFYRLRKSWEYQLISKMGCKFYTPHFVLLVFDNDVNHVRLGVTVSRRVGNAVQRNKVKRAIREFFRTNQNSFLVNKDYSVIARAGAASIPFLVINRELKKIFALPESNTLTR
ncbi:MAG: ribonuclease P protein component [Desulfuromonadales bacterium]|nr:ribonuclease P protein component [Desulfuromonadales bacterium]